jgi:hypothetical protein
MKRIIVGMLTAVILAVSACGVNVTAGTVAEKRVVEAHTTQEEITEEECEWDTDTSYVGGKKKTTKNYECEQVGTGEFEDVEHPAEYFFTLEDKEGNTEEISVDAETYESVDQGEFFDSEK